MTSVEVVEEVPGEFLEGVGMFLPNVKEHSPIWGTAPHHRVKS